MAYLDLDTNYITQVVLEELARETNLTYLSPGSKTRILLDIVNEKLELQASQLDINTGRAFIRNADGFLLDFIGELFGVERELSQKSEVNSEERNFRFYTLESNFGAINLGADIFIAAGALRVFNTADDQVNQVAYINTNDITLKANETELYFSAEAEGLGGDYNVGSNTLTNHDFSGYSDALNRSLLVNNQAAITYGENEESDENYRFRIQQQSIAGEAANFSAIRLGVLSIPGVSDVVRIKYPRGIGTADWLVKSVTPETPSSLISNAQQAIEDEQASGMDNLAKSPVTIGLQLIFSLTYRSQIEDSEKSKIKTAVRKNITDYVNNLAIGERLIGDQIKKVILNSDSRIESIGETGQAQDFSRINIYKRSATSDSVVRRTIVDNYRTFSNERVIMEPNVTASIVITDNN